MIRSTAICAVLMLTAMGLCVPAFADDSVETAPDMPVSTSIGAVETPQRVVISTPVPAQATSIEHVDILVENEPLSVRLQRTDTDGALIEASPIFAQLKGKVSVEGTVLSYIRFQDGAVMTLDVADGKIRANDIVLGALPEFKPRAQADTWLSTNAIAVLTGTNVQADGVGGWSFTLDDRLRPQFDLNLYVNGEQIDVSRLEPRTIGPVLLVPLEAIVEALGHSLERKDGNVIEVTRIQDAVRITLDLSTGLVNVNNIPRGVTPNIAYADPTTLLLPFTAVETLTGTHILLEPGSSRIDVQLDDRLGGGALPGERVVDEAAATGFTPESLEFQLSDRGPAIVQFDSRVRNYNTQLRYETVGGLTSAEELAPGWVGLEVQSLNGWVGSVGDANTRFRELAGVDENRIRGLTYRQQTKKGGILAIAGGVPLTGAEQVSANTSRPTFGGFAGGARLISPDGTREIGLSAALSDTGGDDRVVFSLQREVDRSDNEEGLKGVFLSGDLGVFNGPRGTDVDARARIQARYKLSEQIGLQGNLSYDGARFSQGGGLSETPDFEGVLSDGQGSRFVGSVSTDWRSVKNWGPVTNVAAGVQTSFTHTTGDRGGSTVSVVGSANGQIAAAGLDVSADIGFSQSDVGIGDKSTSNSVNIRAFKRFEWGALQATYSNVTTDGDTDQRFVSSVQVNPFRRNFGRGATIAAGPSASVVWTPEQTFARIGATVSANSGQRFGDRFNLQGQLSALQSVDPEDSSTDFFASLAATYDITRNIRLESTYFDNLQGERNFAVAIRGRLTFNEPRKHTRPKDGLGVLRGQVFFDRNRDGIRQEDEPGLPGVRVQVTGTRLGLGVDRDGRFTIQNMREGLYGLVVDRRTLPLGLLVPEDSAARVTIGDGRITEIDIPIIASGQIRGAVFVDSNGNGETDRGEQRIEGMYLTLKRTGEDAEEEARTGLSATFGQYSFENLSPGTYELSVNHKGVVYSQSVNLTEQDLFAVIPFALPAEDLPSGADPGLPGVNPYDGPVIGEA